MNNNGGSLIDEIFKFTMSTIRPTDTAAFEEMQRGALSDWKKMKPTESLTPEELEDKNLVMRAKIKDWVDSHWLVGFLGMWIIWFLGIWVRKWMFSSEAILDDEEYANE